MLKERKKEAKENKDDAWYKLWELARNQAFGGNAEIDFDEFVSEGKKIFELKLKE